jgi:hypothetical protein
VDDGTVINTLGNAARDRVSYGIDGGYIVITYVDVVEVGLPATGRWARRCGSARWREYAAAL